MIFIESGLFFGFFLPGDSLLFTAGFMASQGLLPLTFLVIGSMVCAISAGYVGYWFGRTVGHKLFEKADSLFFRKRHLEETKRFFEKYGNKTVVLSRFVPIVRTFGPIFAGIGEMNFHHFSLWNIIGGILWPGIVISTGYYLGRLIPGAEKYLLLFVLLIIIISILPGLLGWQKNKKEK
jgi:membrane-associated protein